MIYVITGGIAKILSFTLVHVYCGTTVKRYKKRVILALSRIGIMANQYSLITVVLLRK
jgi:hypothetical protein